MCFVYSAIVLGRRPKANLQILTRNSADFPSVYAQLAPQPTRYARKASTLSLQKVEVRLLGIPSKTGLSWVHKKFHPLSRDRLPICFLIARRCRRPGNDIIVAQRSMKWHQVKSETVMHIARRSLRFGPVQREIWNGNFCRRRLSRDQRFNSLHHTERPNRATQQLSGKLGL
jgi:hypothetical protein